MTTATAAVGTPAETVHSHSLSEESIAGGTATGGKVCCVCGKDVSHAERFKDKKGRYWCYDCGKADSQKRHQNDLAKCPSCAESFPESELVEHENHHICKRCLDKHLKAMKREAARKAAAEQAARDAQRRHKQIIWGSVAFAVVALGIVAWAVFV